MLTQGNRVSQDRVLPPGQALVSDHAKRRFILYHEHIELPEDFDLTGDIGRVCAAQIQDCLKRSRKLSPACCLLFLKKGGEEFAGYLHTQGRSAVLSASDKNTWGEYYFDATTNLCFVVADDRKIRTVVTVIDPDEQQWQTLQELIVQEDARSKTKLYATATQTPAHKIEICSVDYYAEVENTDDPDQIFDQSENLAKDLLNWIARAQPGPEHRVRLLMSNTFDSVLLDPLRQRFAYGCDTQTMPLILAPEPNLTITRLLFGHGSRAFAHTLVLVTPHAVKALLCSVKSYTGIIFGDLTHRLHNRNVIGFNYPPKQADEPSFTCFTL